MVDNCSLVCYSIILWSVDAFVAVISGVPNSRIGQSVARSVSPNTGINLILSRRTR